MAIEKPGSVNSLSHLEASGRLGAGAIYIDGANPAIHLLDIFRALIHVHHIDVGRLTLVLADGIIQNMTSGPGQIILAAHFLRKVREYIIEADVIKAEFPLNPANDDHVGLGILQEII